MLVERPDEGGFARRAVAGRLRTILVEAMAAVLATNLSMAVEMTLARCWSKDARWLAQDDRGLA